MLRQHRRRPTRLCKIKFVYSFVLINYINLSIQPRYHDGGDGNDDGNDDGGDDDDGSGRGRGHDGGDGNDDGNDDGGDDDDGRGRDHQAAVDNNGDDVGRHGRGRGRGRGISRGCNHRANGRPTADDQPAADHQHDLPGVSPRGRGTRRRSNPPRRSFTLPNANANPRQSVMPE